MPRSHMEILIRGEKEKLRPSRCILKRRPGFTQYSESEKGDVLGLVTATWSNLRSSRLEQIDWSKQGFTGQLVNKK